MLGARSIIKRSLSTRFPIGWASGRKVVLCYHHLAESLGGLDSPSYTTCTDLFVQHMGTLQGLFDLVPLDDLMQRRSKGRSRASITFDDGFMSVYSIARPILRSMGIPYTVFVNGAAIEDGHNWVVDLVGHAENMDYHAALRKAAGLKKHLGAGEGGDTIGAIMAQGQFTKEFAMVCRSVAPPSGVFMGRNELEQLVAEGVTIGDHGWDHYVMGRCTPQVAVEQVSKGRELIKELTGAYPLHFALPFGKKEHFTAGTLEIIGGLGYRYVHTTNPNLVSRTHAVHGVQLVPRIGLVNDPADKLLFYLNRALLREHDL